MTCLNPKEFKAQQDYYARTAEQYDEWHNEGEHEHDFALTFLIAYMRFAGVQSVLDIGSGTGRAIKRIKSELPGVRIVGIEPSADLRTIGHGKHGLAPNELVPGNALDLEYKDATFDIVSEFGALHHIRTPKRAVSEMLRVARKAVFISDCNNFGQGSVAVRAAKQLLDATRLLPLTVWLKTRGKMYHYSEGDGISYSYSVFNNYDLIEKYCSRIHVMNTKRKSRNMYREASHVPLLGIKD